MNTVIRQYIRGRKNSKVGILIAVKDSAGVVRAGYSLCNRKDKFDRKFGEEMAMSRMTYTTPLQFPRSVKSLSHVFHARAKRYFKVGEVLWGSELVC